MNRLVSFSLALAVGIPGLLAQRVDPARTALPDKSSRIVEYEMTVRLDAERRVLHGSQKITYRNQTRGSTSELRFHLYLNAFRNVRSTHLREEAPAARERYESDAEFGETRFTKLELVSGAGGPKDLLSGLRYDAPDDGNPEDRTVAVVGLPAPFAAGTEIVLKTEFEARLPKAYRRTGWAPGNFFMVAQWFPKLGVLESAPGDAAAGESAWNCHQFHAWTEFFADYGRYDVTIETPRGWPVGATGKQFGADEAVTVAGVALTRRRFVQEDVHDFAWVTDPDYVVHEFDFDGAAHIDNTHAKLLEKHGWPRSALTLSNVHVRILLHPEHDTELQVARHRHAVEVALAFFGNRFGRYPYETLTVVDPATDLGWHRLGGGMEYPTLITCGTHLYLHPRKLRPEGVTVHEFGHQFWYGLSGNNEFEESWLDEGMNSYSEGRALDLGYDKMLEDPPVGDPIFVTSFGPFEITGKAPARLSSGNRLLGQLALLERLPLPECVESLLPAGTLRDSWHDGTRYASRELGFDARFFPKLPVVDYLRTLPLLSYAKDVPMRNLYGDRNGYLRDPKKDPILTFAWKYLDRSSYRVNSYPRPSTLLTTLERMMGPEKWWPCIRRFHEQARFAHPTTKDFVRLVRKFGGDDVANFAREAFTTTKMLDYGVHSVAVEKKPARTVVTIRRYGEMIVPVAVRFEFAKGKTVDTSWPAAGQGFWRRWTFSEKELAERGKLLRVWVDPPDPKRELGVGPAGVYVMDANLLNNSWQANRDARPARRRGARMLLWAESVLTWFGAIG